MPALMPEIKASRYNSFIRLQESKKLLGYNGISTFAVEFPIDVAETIEKILCSPNGDSTDQELGIKLTLLRGGFLIPEPVDELALLKVKNRQERFCAGSAGYTFLLTKDCNLRCPYCYQQRDKGAMPREVVEAFLELAERDTKGGKPLSMNWFGGEPLLYLDLLLDIHKHLRKIARHNKSDFSQSIITNGYLLTPKVAKQLVKIGCNWAQITLDGPKRIHDTKRVLPGSGPTFDRIVEHIRAASEVMTISVRVNIDKDNVDYVDELLDELEAAKLRGKVTIYFARIQPYTDICADVSGLCFGAQDFSKLESRFAMKKIERGWGVPMYPTLKGGFCCADSLAGKTICPDGTIVKCWNDVSYPEEAIGHLTKPQITEVEMMRNRLKWLAWDPFEKPECVKCPVLPNCMGGCPYVGIRSENQTKGECSLLKYNLGEIIALTYFHERAVEEMKKREGEKEAER